MLLFPEVFRLTLVVRKKDVKRLTLVLLKIVVNPEVKTEVKLPLVNLNVERDRFVKSLVLLDPLVNLEPDVVRLVDVDLKNEVFLVVEVDLLTVVTLLPEVLLEPDVSLKRSVLLVVAVDLERVILELLS